MAGINAERDIYKHLMEVMARLEKVEKESSAEHRKDQERISSNQFFLPYRQGP